jgi:hypothetical protein
MESGGVCMSSARLRVHLAKLCHTNLPNQLRVQDIPKRYGKCTFLTATISIMQLLSIRVKRPEVCMAMYPVTPAAGVVIICSGLLERSVETPCSSARLDPPKAPRL